jgi:hypothetical protein
MQLPVNLEETIDKMVGRRTAVPDPLAINGDSKARSRAWRKAFGGIRVPRGVHRFRKHEEAEEWLWKMITRPRQN